MEKSLNQWKDGMGIFASITCAIHCAATPILLAFLPALKLTEWMASPRFHQIAAVVCVAMVSLAIWPAFRRFRDYRVLSLSTAGLGLLIAAAFFLPDECCSHTDSAVAATDSHAGHNHSPFGGQGSAAHDHSGHNHSSHSHSEPSEATTVLTAGIASPWFLASVQPWMTPLGGILLVIAHGLNLRRRVCTSKSCGCDTMVLNNNLDESAGLPVVSASTQAA